MRQGHLETQGHLKTQDLRVETAATAEDQEDHEKQELKEAHSDPDSWLNCLRATLRKVLVQWKAVTVTPSEI